MLVARVHFGCFESPCLCLSLLSSPLCLCPALCPGGPPLQSSRFLPSPSQPTTQQVERWSPRALLWPGDPCPGLRMMDSAQAPSARGQDPQAELGWGVGLASRALFCRAELRLSPLPPFLRAPVSALPRGVHGRGCSGCRHPFLFPAAGLGACALPTRSGLGCELEPPGHHAARATPGQVWGPVWTQHAVQKPKPDRTAVASCAGDEARAAGPRAAGALGKGVGARGLLRVTSPRSPPPSVCSAAGFLLAGWVPTVTSPVPPRRAAGDRGAAAAAGGAEAEGGG